MREELLRAMALKQEEIEINGTKAWIRELDVAGRDNVLSYATHHQDKPLQTFAYLLVHTLFGEDGKPVFTLDDMEAILMLSGQWLDTLGRAAMKICGLDVDSVDAAKKN